jgi:hypothetical protein
VPLWRCSHLLTAGETDLVLEGLTAIESEFEFVVFTLVCDPVRKDANAAKRGRDALAMLGCGATSPFAVALLVMRAAS